MESYDLAKNAVKEKKEMFLIERPEVKVKEEKEKHKKFMEDQIKLQYPGKQGLITAASKGDVTAAKVLWQLAGGNSSLSVINMQDESSENTPLHAATINGHLETCEYLCSSNCDVDARNYDGWSSLHIAAQKGHFDICQSLCRKYGAAINIRNDKHLNCTPLHQATHLIRVEPIKVLVKNGADYRLKDDHGKTCLNYAREMDNMELIDLLQKIDQIPRYVEMYPTEFGLINATLQNDYDAAEVLILSPGILTDTVDSDGRTALMHAASKGFAEIASLLCHNKANVNFEEKWDGNTALHLASWSGQKDICKVILDHKGKIDAQNEAGWTALHYACEHGHTDVVKLLLEFGADASLQNSYGYTCLAKAAQFNRVGIVHELCSQHPEIINMKLTSDGSTALHLASQNGHHKIIQALLKFNADRDIRNNYRRTPLDIALRYEKKRPECVNVLIHTKDLNRKARKKSQHQRQIELLRRG